MTIGAIDKIWFNIRQDIKNNKISEATFRKLAMECAAMYAIGGHVVEAIEIVERDPEYYDLQVYYDTAEDPYMATMLSQLAETFEQNGLCGPVTSGDVA